MGRAMNLQPVGDQHGEGFPIFDLNASQVDALTGEE